MKLLSLILLASAAIGQDRVPQISAEHQKEWYKAEAALAHAQVAKMQAESTLISDCGSGYAPNLVDNELTCVLKPTAETPKETKPTDVPKH